ncbi:sugar phosphate isomerase/epimerase family protein [Anaerocolumna sp. MB42-C2]|uniref:sugar phosphate isomerase/epimerase family protein n=1 Tax=Anaerocolumna sp. MB42-C2 TaxID=3070997 RepID=UPI0027E1AD3A|nr:TIM barrel protein [Anaerocolumna sp. MB42-C2]WMJ88956.1 TIM barrel protein [Anaerocolumna sp. MB42-C2]
MKNVKIAAPLYILREECEKDLFSVLEKLKTIGFDGIEFLGFFKKTPEEIRDKLEQLNLKAVGNHVDYSEFVKDVNTTIKIHKEIGCQFITITGLSKEQFTDNALVSKYISDVKEIGKLCRENGITLLFHNHDRELAYKMKDKYYLEEILDSIPKELLSFEPDLGWIAIGGGKPEYFLAKYKSRCPIIHLKDFYAMDLSSIGDVFDLNNQKGDAGHSHFEFRPVGYGILNIPALMELIKDCNPSWLLADHDLAYERDSYFDLKISLDYIKNLLLL